MFEDEQKRVQFLERIANGEYTADAASAIGGTPYQVLQYICAHPSFGNEIDSARAKASALFTAPGNKDPN